MSIDRVFNPAGAEQITPVTVREHLDQRIAEARRMVEVLCVAKAKAEVLGLLDAPHAQLVNIIYPSGPF